MTDEKTQSSPGITEGPGVPFREFEAGVDVFKKLREQGRFSFFQGRNDSVRMIGELEELVVSLQKLPEMEKVDSATAKRISDEIRKLVQVSMTWPDDNRAQSVLEDGVFNDDFEALEKQHETV